MPVQLLAAGSNAHGQLANGTVDDAHTFTRCQFAPAPHEHAEVVAVACGANHTLVLLSGGDGADNTVWATGHGAHGQLGGLPESRVFAPLQLPAIYKDFNPIFIAAAWETSFVALRGSDTDVLLSFGANEFGDLGRGAETGHGIHPVDLSEAGPRFRISSVSAGPHHVVALLHSDSGEKSTSHVMGWGASRHKQLGVRDAVIASPILMREALSDSPKRVIAAACGNQHTLLLTADGCVDALGSDRKGQTSPASDLTGIRVIGCTWSASYAIASNGVVHAFGNENPGQRAPPASTVAHNKIRLDPAKSTLACGSEHVLVLTEGHITRAWGWNEHGNLGLGHIQDVKEATRIGFRDDGSARRIVGVWGGCGTSWLAVENVV